MEAINYASRSFVSLNELHDAVAERLASMLKCEAAMVTAGAASALTLGTAGCLTGTDSDLIRRLPDTEGMKTEVIIQKSHRFGYDHAVRNCGVSLIEVETSEQLKADVSEQTAMMVFLNKADSQGEIQREEFVALGKELGIPTFNDAAADVPPPERLFEYTAMGFDLVTFSGGKGLRGPQSSGLLLGRKDLIQAARLNAPPNGDTIGRGMKVNKEEILGLMVAVERFLSIDPEKARHELDRYAEEIINAVKSVPSVQTEIDVPEIANHVPHIHIRWDERSVGVTVEEVIQKLRMGDPSIEVTPSSGDHLTVNPFMLQPGESAIVARRICECFGG
jgi:L-seryl-tRNA(Ser) seleniumtransferase